MLILAKTALAMMIGFIISTISGLIIIPLLRKIKVGQRISIYLGEHHRKKSGTPTMGGLIFIIPTLLTVVILLLLGKLQMSYNLGIVLFVFVAYAFLGFLDDYLSIKRNNNVGLTEIQKLFGQLLIAIVFFFLFMKSGSEPLIWIHWLGIKVDIGIFYGLFILFMLVGASNAVNLTDGLDGLAGGLSAIAFLVYGILSWSTGWLQGYEDIALFCFVLAGSVIGFLFYNTYPAKVFMGDTGSLALGATLAAVAILTRREISLIIVGGVFVIETLSVIIQILSIKLNGRKIFLMTPLHHHFEKLGWEETDIVKLFWVVGLILGMAAIAYGVWI